MNTLFTKLSSHWNTHYYDAVAILLHIISDGAIAISYMLILMGLGYFVYKRKKLSFNIIFISLITFILIWIITHLIGIWFFWEQSFYISSYLKAFTAVIAFITAILLLCLVPKALELPHIDSLMELNLVLLESEKLYKDILENAPDAIVITNNKGVIEMVNSQVKLLFGYEKEEILGKTVEYLIPERYHRNHIGHRGEYFKKPHTRPMGAGLELFGRRKDGSEFAVEISLSPVKTAKGLLALAAIRDITEKLRIAKLLIEKNKTLEEQSTKIEDYNNSLERALEKQKKISAALTERTHLLEIQKTQTDTERYFKNLLNSVLQSSIDYAIISTDLDGKILIWNEGAKRHYGYTPAEVVQKQNIDIVFNPEDVAQNLIKILTRQAYRQEIAEGIYEHVTKDGNHFFASVSITLRRDESNEPIGYVMISKDISKQKALEEQLIKNNKELEQFAYVASHDLKAPLRSIESLIAWIKKDEGNHLSEESKNNFRLIVSRAQRMSNLIEGILQYSRVGRIESDIVIVSVKNMLDEIIATLNPPSNFIIHYQGNLPIFDTPLIMLSQVFMNLISNAIKYNDKKEGRVDIGFKEYPNYYEFFVQDNGPGIEPEYHQKIFEIFQTLQPRDVIESTGIGLSIVKKIVEQQGGNIWLTSAIGKGTTFYFSWPKRNINKR